MPTPHSPPKDLHQLLKGLARVEAEPTGITGLTDDSRRVRPGDLFICRDPAYLEDALSRQPAAVLIAEGGPKAQGAAAYAPAVDQTLAGRVADRFFGEPAASLNLIGITGTNGKTTVATLTQYLLNFADVKCGLLGTVAVDHGGPEGAQPAELTTPGAIELRQHFAAMRDHGCQAVAMEVSSHALDQGRVAGLSFAAAVFTNLTQDHLDYHGDMTRYAAAKAKLFEHAAISFANADDPAWLEVAPQAVQLRLDADSTCSAYIDSMSATGTEAHLVGPWGEAVCSLGMVGRYNVMNLLQAVCAAHTVREMGPSEIEQAVMDAPPVPGRLQPVPSQPGTQPAVLVDYAHTPDALVNVLQTLKPLTQGELVVVVGCGGDRDRTKRPIMAKAACEYAGRVVLTNDNPRTEDPQQILEDMQQGVVPGSPTETIVNRAEAIRHAIHSAKPGDTVLLAGKGHEDYQILGTTKHPFDDRLHAAEALASYPSR